MISVDISNIWCSVSLPKLLEMEKAVFDAHAALRKDRSGLGEPMGWPAMSERWDRSQLDAIRQAAERLRTDTQTLVVLGPREACQGSRAVLELLQERSRAGVRVLFVPDTLSSRGWKRLAGKLEDTEFSLLVIAPGELELTAAVQLRSLRWMMQRQYGADKANRRIFAVTELTRGPLCRMAAEEGWTRFSLPRDPDGLCDGLSAGGLLPLAAAGLSAEAVLEGAEEAAKELDIRSFENPAWLYAASRHLLSRTGVASEVLWTPEPDAQSLLGFWGRQLSAGEGGAGRRLVPTWALGPEQLSGPEDGRNVMESILTFQPPEHPIRVEMDWKNVDGFNYLEEKTFEDVAQARLTSALELHGERQIPFVLLEAGALEERTAGQLLYFLEFSGALSRYLAKTQPETGGRELERRARAALGQPER